MTVSGHGVSHHCSTIIDERSKLDFDRYRLHVVVFGALVDGCQCEQNDPCQISLLGNEWLWLLPRVERGERRVVMTFNWVWVRFAPQQA